MSITGTKSNIFREWLAFQFVQAPKAILRAWNNFLLFNYNYFSIGVLFRTLFSYWHKYHWAPHRGFDIGDRAGVLLSNLISRILGAIMRVFIIAAGVLTEIFIFVCGFFIFIAWFLLPFFLAAGICWSIAGFF